MGRLVACLVLLVAAVYAGRHDKYEGHQVYRIGGSNEELGYLQGNLDILSAIPASRSTSGHLEALVRISAEEKDQWLEYFDKKGITYTKIIDNLAEILRNEDAKIAKSRSFTKPFVRDNNDDGEDISAENASSDENASTSGSDSGSESSSEENSKSEENTGSEEGTGSQEGAGSEEGAGSQEGAGSGEGTGSQEGAGSEEGARSEEGADSQEGAGSEEGTGSQEGAGSEEGAGSQEGAGSEEGAGSQEGTGSVEEPSDDLIWDNLRWDTYYRHDEINAFIDDLGAKYPNLVTVINAALSFEGRQIKYVRISTTRFENLRKPVIVIDAMMHAREWLTTPVAMYIINQLVVDIVDSQLVDRLDWVIIPLANPDGYEYSIDEDRLWRKTRSTNHVGADLCPGVDGNRNFDHHWGTALAAADPCSIIYQGPGPFSEPEVRVVRDVVMQHINRAAMYISIHTYGNMFLYAWGNNGTLPSNALSLHLAGVRMTEAIDKLALDKAKRYVVGNAAQILYFNTGTSRDWTRAVGIPLTYTLELPGYEYDFVVPPEYIPQVVKETWAGIVEGAKYVISLYN